MTFIRPLSALLTYYIGVEENTDRVAGIDAFGALVRAFGTGATLPSVSRWMLPSSAIAGLAGMLVYNVR